VINFPFRGILFLPPEVMTLLAKIDRIIIRKEGQNKISCSNLSAQADFGVFHAGPATAKIKEKFIQMIACDSRLGRF
jgi:hypothetical protein